MSTISTALDDIFSCLLQLGAKRLQVLLYQVKKKRITQQIKSWQSQLNRCKCDFINDISIDFTPAILALTNKTSL